jgi:flagellar basal-body rod protein FlgB
MANEIQGVTMQLGMMALDAYAARHQVLANNIANADTDSYRPLRLNFEEQLDGLRSAIASGSSDAEVERLVARVHPYVELRQADPVLGDSHQRLDEEMTLIAQNTIQYEAMLAAINHETALTRTAITGEG